MLKQQVVEFFGSRNAAAAAIGITGEAISMWGDNVPRSRVRSVELAMAAELERRRREEQKQRARERRQAKKEDQQVR